MTGDGLQRWMTTSSELIDWYISPTWSEQPTRKTELHVLCLRCRPDRRMWQLCLRLRIHGTRIQVTQRLQIVTIHSIF